VLNGANTYTSATTINSGVLQAVDGTGLPTASLLQLRGGVLQSSGTFTRSVTTSAGGVNWSTSSGGFAAIGAPLVLNLNGGTGSLTWNGSSFVQTGQTLIFGSTSADNLVDFQNSINLGSSGTNNRTISVIDNPNSTTDRARISGNLTNTAAGQGIIKSGDGTLELTGTNTYTGPTSVNAGALLVNGNNSAATGAVTVAAGATLGGTGTIGGLTTIDGVHAPGASPGIQTFTSGVTYNGGMALEWELNSNTDAGRGVNFDGVDVTGGVLTIAAGATSNLIFNSAGSTVDWTDPFWETDHSWLVFDNANAPSLASAAIFDTITVSVDSLNQPFPGESEIGLFEWALVDNDVYLNFTSAAAVPEPASLVVWTLIALGLTGVGIGRMQGKRHHLRAR
jgi:autotransporter-associated beta strand protein